VAYKIESKGSGIYTIGPKRFWSIFSYADLIAALSELSSDNRIVSVMRYFDWANTRYVVITEKK